MTLVSESMRLMMKQIVADVEDKTSVKSRVIPPGTHHGLRGPALVVWSVTDWSRLSLVLRLCVCLRAAVLSHYEDKVSSLASVVEDKLADEEAERIARRAEMEADKVGEQTEGSNWRRTIGKDQSLGPELQQLHLLS